MSLSLAAAFAINYIVLLGLQLSHTLTVGSLFAIIFFSGFTMGGPMYVLPPRYSFDLAGPRYGTTAVALVDASGIFGGTLIQSAVGQLMTGGFYDTYICVLCSLALIASTWLVVSVLYNWKKVRATQEGRGGP